MAKYIYMTIINLHVKKLNLHYKNQFSYIYIVNYYDMQIRLLRVKNNLYMSNIFNFENATESHIIC